MEARPKESDSEAGNPLPPERMLVSGTSRMERIALHSKGLVEDLTAWIDLKLRVTQLELQEKIESKVQEIILRALPVVVGALAGLFLLVTIALGLGWWLGHPFWGFLIITGMLFVLAALLRARARSAKAHES